MTKSARRWEIPMWLLINVAFPSKKGSVFWHNIHTFIIFSPKNLRISNIQMSNFGPPYYKAESPEITVAIYCNWQIIRPKVKKMQAILFFCPNYLHIWIICCNFAAESKKTKQKRSCNFATYIFCLCAYSAVLGAICVFVCARNCRLLRFWAVGVMCYVSSM